MKESIQMFAPTREAIRLLLASTESQLGQIAINLGGMESDGDNYDDASVRENLRLKELLEAKKTKLRRLILPETELIEEPTLSKGISLGHEVVLSIQDGEGQSEMVATIGTTFDRTYLNGEITIISEESPMGKLLIGKQIGATIECNLGDIKQVQILGVHSSPLLGS